MNRTKVAFVVAASVVFSSAWAAEVTPEVVAACSSADEAACQAALAKMPPCENKDQVCENERIGYAQLGNAYAMKHQACQTGGSDANCSNAKQMVDAVTNRLSQSINASQLSGSFTSSSPVEMVLGWGSQSFRAGDCQSDGVSVTLRSDGTGHLKSTSFTYRTHSGDYWWWTITGYDADKVILWTVPFQKGPRMSDAGSGGAGPKVHNDFDFKFDGSKYGSTKYVGLGYRC